jgi:hypothetical protein
MLLLLGYSEQHVKSYSAKPSLLGAEILALTKDPDQDHLSYPVTGDWCARVKEALIATAKKAGLPGRGAMSKLREHLDVSSGHLSDVLSGKYKTSPLVGPIHEFFGWELPLPPTASLDAGEIVHGYLRMSGAQRKMLDEAMDILQGASGEEAKATLSQMLKFMKRPKND